MKVYRVQTPRGTGPYFDGGFQAWCSDDELDPNMYDRLSERHQFHWKTPNPRNDYGVRGHTNCHRFGFASKRSLREWFTPTARRLMHEAGFHVSVYDVPREDVMQGMCQVAFLLDNATHVESKSLLEF